MEVDGSSGYDSCGCHWLPLLLSLSLAAAVDVTVTVTATSKTHAAGSSCRGCRACLCLCLVLSCPVLSCPAPAFFDRNCPQQWKEPKPRRSTRKRDLCSFIRSFGDRIPDGYLERERNRKWQHQTWISPHHFDKAGRGTVQYSSDIPPTGQQPLIYGRRSIIGWISTPLCSSGQGEQ